MYLLLLGLQRSYVVAMYNLYMQLRSYRYVDLASRSKNGYYVDLVVVITPTNFCSSYVLLYKIKYSFRSLYHALPSIHPFTGKERPRTGEGERHIPAEAAALEAAHHIPAAASGVGHHIPAAASWAAVASWVGHHIPAAASWAAVA